jgi:hypothetical protein
MGAKNTGAPSCATFCTVAGLVDCEDDREAVAPYTIVICKSTRNTIVDIDRLTLIIMDLGLRPNIFFLYRYTVVIRIMQQ